MRIKIDIKSTQKTIELINKWLNNKPHAQSWLNNYDLGMLTFHERKTPLKIGLFIFRFLMNSSHLIYKQIGQLISLQYLNE